MPMNCKANHMGHVPHVFTPAAVSWSYITLQLLFSPMTRMKTKSVVDLLEDTQLLLPLKRTRTSNNRLLGTHRGRLLYCCCYCQHLAFFSCLVSHQVPTIIVTTIQQRFVKMCRRVLTCADRHPSSHQAAALIHWCLSALPPVCRLCFSINSILYSWWSHIMQSPTYQ